MAAGQPRDEHDPAPLFARAPVWQVHRFSIDVILRTLCQVTTADRFIADLQGGSG
jgi:hypothetical protein